VRYPPLRRSSCAAVAAGSATPLPQVAPTCARTRPDRLPERLRAGQLDTALIALPYDTGELLVRELFRDEFWFVARGRSACQGQGVAVKQLGPGSDPAAEEGTACAITP
jgi:hypothetical protein